MIQALQQSQTVVMTFILYSEETLKQTVTGQPGYFILHFNWTVVKIYTGLLT